jgi:hypothetical protein
MAVHRLRTVQEAGEVETLAARMERLRADAGAVAQEHIAVFIDALAKATALAEEVASGGESYAIGVREIARRTHKELSPVVLSLQAVHLRGGGQ